MGPSAPEGPSGPVVPYGTICTPDNPTCSCTRNWSYIQRMLTGVPAVPFRPGWPGSPGAP